MAKKLTEEKIQQILDVGIREFAEKGYDGANTNQIAKKAGISSGVLFKYFESKEKLFLACLRKSLVELEDVLRRLEDMEGDFFTKVRMLLGRIRSSGQEHLDYIRMYHTLTLSNRPELARRLAREIEEKTCGIYRNYIQKAQERGEIRTDISPEYAAFLFDNVLMMLQFSGTCTYYQERYRIYMEQGNGESVDYLNEKMTEQVMCFLEGALGKADAGEG